MNRQQALAMFAEIVSGEGFDRESAKDIVGRGEVPEQKWYDGLFSLGMEYGALFALVYVFDLKDDEIKRAIAAHVPQQYT